MPCSICHQKGHNKQTCPKNQEVIFQPEPDYTNIDIFTFIKDVLNCIDNVQDINMHKYLLTDSEPTTSHIMVSLYSEAEEHCGYCSDNDGTTHSYEYDRDKIYVILPAELSNQIPDLQKFIDDDYFNNYELSWHSQCYCGGNSIKNTIISLDIIRI